MQKNFQEYEKIRTFLRHHPMSVLSTAVAPGTVWGAGVYYLADRDLNIHFVVRSETFKYKSITAQPFAALTVADPDT